MLQAHKLIKCFGRKALTALHLELENRRSFSASDKQYNFVFDTSSDDSDAMPWDRERLNGDFPSHSRRSS